jgi:hypothetical protein
LASVALQHRGELKEARERLAQSGRQLLPLLNRAVEKGSAQSGHHPGAGNADADLKTVSVYAHAEPGVKPK